eukprot:TRINITY_DN67769_c11_g1_i1.p3 TRINITY_DN67769_c11_g1~~TRINITY_DN67769_c11_g1_i1.p3  ORF type:complete len:143 (-),score=8.82 TRINITY_DN67769_c11_g1_i1:475-903(-)
MLGSTDLHRGYNGPVFLHSRTTIFLLNFHIIHAARRTGSPSLERTSMSSPESTDVFRHFVSGRKKLMTAPVRGTAAAQIMMVELLQNSDRSSAMQADVKLPSDLICIVIPCTCDCIVVSKSKSVYSSASPLSLSSSAWVAAT